MKRIILITLLLLSIAIFSGCTTSSQRVAWDLDYSAEEFELVNRIIAINGMTDKPLFEIIGQCSIETSASYADGTMEVICKIGYDDFSKHSIYLPDNVLVVVEQLEGIDVPQHHYQINFAPQSILPIPVITGGRLGE